MTMKLNDENSQEMRHGIATPTELKMRFQQSQDEPRWQGQIVRVLGTTRLNCLSSPFIISAFLFHLGFNQAHLNEISTWIKSLY